MLHIAGSGDQRQFFDLAQKVNVENKIVWHGQVRHEQVNAMMRQSDLFFFTSIMEATSTVVMEAIQNRLPVVCFDTCGFGTVVNDTIGIKVQLSNPEQSVRDFSYAIRYLYEDRNRLKALSDNCKDRIKLFVWDYKAQMMVNLYKIIIA